MLDSSANCTYFVTSGHFLAGKGNVSTIVCLFVCLFVSRITQKVMDDFDEIREVGRL